MTTTDGIDLRERGKERRRSRVLEAAREMIREAGVDGLTMGPLAQAAEVSLATIYNLFGDRTGVLDAIVARVTDDLVPRLDDVDDDPLERSRTFITTSVVRLTTDSRFFRPLVVALAPGANPFLLGVRDVAARSVTVHASAIAAAIDRRRLRPDLSPDLLGYQIFVGWVTTQTLWGLGAIDDDDFRRLALYHRAVVLLSVATPTTRARLLADIADHEPPLIRSLEAIAEHWARPPGVADP